MNYLFLHGGKNKNDFGMNNKNMNKNNINKNNLSDSDMNQFIDNI